LIINQYKENTSVIALTSWTLYPRSSWYYIPTQGRRGISPSTHTQKKDGTKVINQQVLEDIKRALTGDLGFYGYEKTTWDLHDLGYMLNKKKVYRLNRRWQELPCNLTWIAGLHRWLQGYVF